MIFYRQPKSVTIYERLAYVRGGLLQEDESDLLQENSYRLLLEQAMPDLAITQTTLATSLDIRLDMVPVVDVSDTTNSPNGRTKHISVGNLGEAIGIVNVFNYMTAAEQADVLARTELVDVTAAIQTAIDAHDFVYMPEGTYLTSSAIVISDHDRRLIGSGIGITIIRNTGTGNGIECKSAGGVDSTKLRITASDFTVEGDTDTLAGLYVYDVADSRFINIESKNNGGAGINAEMNVDNAFVDCYCHNNDGDGFLLNAALKNSVEFTSNQNDIRNLVSNSNGGNGLSITRSYGNTVDAGEYSSNANGIVITGGKRNRIRARWIENNTTDGIKTAQSTSPTTINSEDNDIDAHVAGTGNVTIANGTQNKIDGYIAADLTISGGADTPNTTIMPGLQLVGTLTDNGSATRDLRPTATYIKQSTVKRYQRTIGSTVDYTSDIQAFRFGMVKGVSGTATQANNLRGQVTFAGAATATVTFGTAEDDATYFIATSGDVNENFWATAKGTSGFTINSSNAASTANVDWILIR